jgi:hypothetical protein
MDSGDLVSHRDRGMERLRKTLNAFQLNTAVKAEIERRWPELLSGHMDLRSFAALTGGQADVLANLLANSSPLAALRPRKQDLL